jgi:hypothetical protein
MKTPGGLILKSGIEKFKNGKQQILITTEDEERKNKSCAC